MVTIKLYSYSKLVLAYGRERGATVTVQWNSTLNAFTLIFGKYGLLINRDFRFIKNWYYFGSK